MRDQAYELAKEVDNLRAENERLRAALQWIEAQAGNVDSGLVKHMCNRALAGKDPAGIYDR